MCFDCCFGYVEVVGDLFVELVYVEYLQYMELLWGEFVQVLVDFVFFVFGGWYVVCFWWCLGFIIENGVQGVVDGV